MEKFTTHTGVGVPMQYSNVDTDQIIPAVYLKRITRTGFDDALFVDAQGRLSEGSLWNIGFVSGEHIVWPRASMLGGVAQRLIERGAGANGLACETREIAVRDLAAFEVALTGSATARSPRNVPSTATSSVVRPAAAVRSTAASSNATRKFPAPSFVK